MKNLIIAFISACIGTIVSLHSHPHMHTAELAMRVFVALPLSTTLLWVCFGMLDTFWRNRK